MRTSNEEGVRTRQEDSDDEDVIMDSWVNHLVGQGWRAGRRELVTGVHHTTKNIKANPGQLQWSIFFFERADIDMEVFEKRLQAHPFVASSERQVEKDLVQQPGDHLSPWNLWLRTRSNFSVLCGYTKYGDDLRPEGQLTHLWMKLTKGNTGRDGGEHNLQLLANLLCETAMFDLPYPDALGAERVRLFLESAVGDSSGISATAVGAAVGRTAERNGGRGTHQPSPPGPQQIPPRPLRISEIPPAALTPQQAAAFSAAGRSMCATTSSGDIQLPKKYYPLFCSESNIWSVSGEGSAGPRGPPPSGPSSSANPRPSSSRGASPNDAEREAEGGERRCGNGTRGH